jgi:MarR family transcriptional regulator, organic hydroperoxide resistance regulator
MGRKKNQTGIDLVLLLNSLTRQLNNRLARHIDLGEQEITVEQLSLLIGLWTREGMSQQELGDFVDKDRPSVTRLLDNMEKNNLVVRITSESDRRIRLIYLTRKGRELQEKLFKLADGVVKNSLNGVDSETIGQFLSVAGLIRSGIQKKNAEDALKMSQSKKN